MKIRDKKVLSVDDKNKVKTYSLLSKNKLKVQNTNHERQNQLDWLQKMVDGFEWYKMKKNPLFLNQTSQTQEKTQSKPTTYKNNIKTIKVGCHRRTLNNIKVSTSIDKNKSITNQIHLKNSEKAKCNVIGKGNKRYSSNNKNKQNTQPIQKNTQKIKQTIKPQEIQLCGIKDVQQSKGTKDLKKQKPRQPLSQKIQYNNKTASIKAARKCLLEDNKKKYGSIKKNSSMEIKQETKKAYPKNQPQEPKKQYLYLDSKEHLNKQLQFHNYESFVQNFSKKEEKKQKVQRKLNSSVQSHRSRQRSESKNTKSNTNLNNSFLNRSYENDRYFTQQNQQKQYKKTINHYEVPNKQKDFIIIEEPQESEHPCEADIIGIFKKLDKDKTGILNSENCYTVKLGEQIKYIIRPIILKITYKNEQYDISKFMIETQKILDTLKHNVQKGLLLPALIGKQEKQKQKSLAVSNQFFSKRSSTNSVVMTKYDLTSKESQYNPALSMPKNQIKFQSGYNQEKKVFRCATFQNEDDVVQAYEVKQRPQTRQDRMKVLDNLQYFREQGAISQVYVKGNNKIDETFQGSGKGQLQKLQTLNQRLEKYIIDRSLEDLKKPMELAKYQ